MRAVKDHKVVNFLEEPGAHDITADVDFGVLSTIASEKGNQLQLFGVFALVSTFALYRSFEPLISS